MHHCTILHQDQWRESCSVHLLTTRCHSTNTAASVAAGLTNIALFQILKYLKNKIAIFLLNTGRIYLIFHLVGVK